MSDSAISDRIKASQLGRGVNTLKSNDILREWFPGHPATPAFLFFPNTSGGELAAGQEGAAPPARPLRRCQAGAGVGRGSPRRAAGTNRKDIRA